MSTHQAATAARAKGEHHKLRIGQVIKFVGPFEANGECYFSYPGEKPAMAEVVEIDGLYSWLITVRILRFVHENAHGQKTDIHRRQITHRIVKKKPGAPREWRLRGEIQGFFMGVAADGPVLKVGEIVQVREVINAKGNA